MGLRDFLDKIVRTKTENGETVTITIPANLYYKHLAVYTAVGLIANAISVSEVLTYMDGKEVRDKDYYTLNVSPNKNQTASQFWHKVIEVMLAGQNNHGQALVVEVKDNLYCADSFSIYEERPILGNIYSDVTIDNFTFNKKFMASEVYLFRLSNKSAIKLIDDMYNEYSKIIESAAGAFKQGNGKKYKLKIDRVQSGDKNFEEHFETVIKKQIESYLKGENAVYPQFAGYDLQEDSSVKNVGADDFLKVKKDMFEMVAYVFNIPLSMMSGNITNINDIISEFLTFGVDPIAVMISEVLNKRAGYENWIRGNYYKVRTSGIYHRDIFNLAGNIDKMIASGAFSVDEVRREVGYAELNTDWSRQHFMTKNYQNIEDILNELKGGEEIEK